MLQFFRKYQKYFFVLTTIVIIMSFSFFGTFSTLSEGQVRDPVAFTAVDGTKVLRSEVDKMALFISTDAEDKLMYGGAWGPNFLNDGVVKKEMLHSGIAGILINAYSGYMNDDIANKHAKEKKWLPYAHPQASFISTQGAWAYFSPTLKASYDTLIQANDPMASDAVNARIAIFLEQNRFPPGLLKQVLRYQEQQFDWVKADPNLDNADLSIFGYHTVDDWFGSKFMRLAAEFIINGSIIAEQNGYKVSKEEALADLMRNSAISYQQNLRYGSLGVASGDEYFNEQLRRLNMDRSTAVRLWQKVMLFKRFFNDMGSSVLADRLSFDQFNAFAKESADGEIYRLPKEMQLNDFHALQKFELYLNATAAKSESPGKDVPLLPRSFLAPVQVAKKWPELVEKRYVLEIASASKDDLQGHVSLRDTWNWETNEGNFKILQKEFPELSQKDGSSAELRLAALDSLDMKSRSRVDRFARNKIVENHPEWITEALASASSKRMEVGIPSKGDVSAIKGLKDNKAFMALLDAAPLNGSTENASEAEKDAQKQLSAYSPNASTYYRIAVLEKAKIENVLTFAEAERKGVLDRLLTRALMSHYTGVHEKDPTKFQGEDKVWKPFADVRDLVAEDYFSASLKNLRNEIKKADNSIDSEKLSLQQLSSLRFLSYVSAVKSLLEQQSELAAKWISKSDDHPVNDEAILSNQWNLVKAPYHVDKGNAKDSDEKLLPFNLPIDQWSSLLTPPNGDIAFFKIKSRGFDASVESAAEQTFAAQLLIGFAAKRSLSSNVIDILKATNAISLEYLNVPYERENHISSEEQSDVNG